MKMYHASPTANRASIEKLGLLGTRPLGMLTVFAISGQPSATYLVPTLTEVRSYITHVFERWFPDARLRSNAQIYMSRGARLASFDIYEVTLAGEALAVDKDWPGAARYTSANVPPKRIRRVGTVTLLDFATK
jgi:hypothetical protein